MFDKFLSILEWPYLLFCFYQVSDRSDNRRIFYFSLRLNYILGIIEAMAIIKIVTVAHIE